MTVFLFMLIILLNACGSETTEEQIHQYLEEAVELEEDFLTYEEEIASLEQEEQDIYETITDLDDFSRIKELSKEALDIIQERSDKLNQERDSIEASEEAFQKSKPLIADLDEKNVRKKAIEMYDVMNERYEAYAHLYELYKDSLSLEEELYTFLQEKDAEPKDVTNKIADINEYYEEIHDATEAFSTYTTRYNELKKEFYDIADLDVTFNEG